MKTNRRLQMISLISAALMLMFKSGEKITPRTHSRFPGDAGGVLACAYVCVGGGFT